jgi:hypothetical protein
MTADATAAGRIVRLVAAVVLGLILGSLPFVYYRYGVGRHHARHAVAETPPSNGR